MMRKLTTEELDRLSTEEYKSADKNPVIVVLDNIRSLNNVGSAFRTSDAFRVEKIFLCGITGTPPNREIHKTALGATDSVAWEYRKSTTELVKELKQKGWTIVSVEQTEGSLMLQNFKCCEDQKYCLIFGNEVFGVDEEVVRNSDFCLEIPQAGTKHSLNISVSIGIVLWDIVSKAGFFR